MIDNDFHFQLWSSIIIIIKINVTNQQIIKNQQESLLQANSLMDSLLNFSIDHPIFLNISSFIKQHLLILWFCNFYFPKHIELSNVLLIRIFFFFVKKHSISVICVCALVWSLHKNRIPSNQSIFQFFFTSNQQYSSKNHSRVVSAFLKICFLLNWNWIEIKRERGRKTNTEF